MDTSQRISQAVSLIPVLISIIILFGGSAGTWFWVQEDIFPAVTSEETVILESHTDYNYHLDGVVLIRKETDGTVISEDKLDYMTAKAQCDGPESICMVYENRGAVFYNMGLVFYAIFSISIVSSMLIFLRDYNLIQNINKQFKVDITRSDLLATSFGAHVSIIVFALFLLLYAVTAIPSAMHDDHAGGVKEDLYTTGITVFGENLGEDAIIEGEEVNLQSRWTIWTAFILFLVGVLVSSIYLTSYTYSQFEEGIDASVAPAPELYFDSEAKLLFDVNTGEVIKSFAGDERSLFFDTEAVVLFDEHTGDIVYSEYFDKFISKKMASVEESDEERLLEETPAMDSELSTSVEEKS